MAQRQKEKISKTGEKPSLAVKKPEADEKGACAKNQAELNMALLEALLRRKNAQVPRLIRAGADIVGKDNHEETHLHRAAMAHNTELCALLICEYAKAGGDVTAFISATSDNGFTALQWAAWNGHAETEKFFKSINWIAGTTGNAFVKSYSECIAA